MLVFKAGSGNNTLPGEAVAYNLGTTLTGSYLTPLGQATGNPCGDDPFPGYDGCTRDISHIALLGKVSTIPLPAAGWLLIAAIGGLGAMRRRKSKT